jgi:hypothetical protein
VLLTAVLAVGPACGPGDVAPPPTAESTAKAQEAAGSWTEEQKEAYKKMKSAEMGAGQPAEGENK